MPEFCRLEPFTTQEFNELTLTPQKLILPTDQVYNPFHLLITQEFNVKLFLSILDHRDEYILSTNEPGVKTTWHSLLPFACFFKEIYIAKLLIASGADVNQDVLQDFPIIQAASTGSVELVQTLLRTGADIDVQTVYNGDNALMIASEKGYADLVELLLASC